MTVYVDDMKAKFGRMVMCHLLADTTEELLTMVDLIGVQRKWIQHPGRHDEHFDIALSKRDLALRYGAVGISWREASAMASYRRVNGVLGTPELAMRWRTKLASDEHDARQKA